MAPIKFEEHIKEQLEKRQIKPSESGWNKLEARLDATKGKSGGNSRWWIGVAAAVVAALVIAGFVFTAKDPVTTPQIVEQPVEKTAVPSVKEATPPETGIASEEVEEEPKERRNSGKAPAFQRPAEGRESEIAATEKENSAEESVAADSVSINPENQHKPEEAVFRSKLEEVIAKVNSAETEEGEITDTEVNALLAEAAKEISRNSRAEYSAGLVDANALLEDVEAEVDESFRQKVFEMLKDGVIKARTAVATRNN
ncbi:hypothetical protein [Zunongwangia sp. H14]|uniref:hypothetical protein n=1 Tax=Zunongwangia sp. H14 TaxID=3240792 RepID=UPI003568322A